MDSIPNSDDIWYENKLKIMLDEIKSNHEIKVFCANELIENFDNKKKKLWFYGPYTNSFYNSLLANGNCVNLSHYCKKIFKKIKFYLMKKNSL